MKKGNFFYRLICGSVLVLSSMYAFNRYSDLYASRKHLLHSKPENYYDWKGIRIYYECKGSGEPIVLLHSIHPASSAYEWSAVINRLAMHHQVYTLDLPGCGRSSKEKMPYSNFFYVELIRDFIHQIVVRRPVVVASGLTCSVAVTASAYDPSLFTSIILISPPSVSSLAETPDLISKTKCAVLNLPIIGTFIYHIMTLRSQIDLSFTERYLYNPFHDNDDLVDTYYESAHLGRGKGHYLTASMIGKYLNFDISHALQNLKVPACVLIGNESKDAALIQTEWSALNPSLQVEKIDHTRELPQLEEPEETIRFIEEYAEKRRFNQDKRENEI